MQDGLTAAVIPTRDGLERLRADWEALWRASGASPFQSPAWLLPWWDAFGSGELLAIALRKNDRLAGLAPLYIEDRTVRLIGTGNTDYLNLIAAPECEVPAAEAVFGCLSSVRACWDECDLLDLPACSALLRGSVPAGLRTEKKEAEACPVIPLPRDVQALDAMIAPRLRKGFRQYGRRFGDCGKFRFERADEALLAEHIEAFFGLHGARWQAGGEPGALADARVREFHRAAAPELWQCGLLRVYGLRDRSGELRGIQYALVRGRRMFGYLAGYDPSLEGFSPGTVMLRLVLEDAISSGCTEFDFLRGREPYKYDWGARDETTWRMRVFPK